MFNSNILPSSQNNTNDNLVAKEEAKSEQKGLSNAISSPMVGTIYLKPDSYVKGTITGDTIKIEGEVDGDIQAKDLHIKSTAKIKGNIRYNNIDIQNGSIINAEFFYSS